MRPLTTNSKAPEPSLASAPDLLDESAADRGWFSHVRNIGLLTFISRILGLIRDVGMATLFGNGPVLDAFTLAFRIPNLFRRLFGEGALTTAFLPEYVKALKQDRILAQQLATAVLCLLTLMLTGLAITGEILLWACDWQEIFSSSSRIILGMTAGLLPYVVMICLSAQFSAMLHAENQFALPAFVPILLNIFWIGGLWSIVPLYDNVLSKISCVIVAILLGGLAQLILPWVALHRQGFRFQRAWKSSLPQARRVFQLMLPVVLGLSVSQLNVLCDGALAWWYSQPEQDFWIAPGTTSALYFGQRMYQFPLGVFGIALSTVLFSRLAQHAETGANKQFAQDVQDGFRYVLMIGLPATCGMILLAPALTKGLFQYGEFDANDARQTTSMIIAYGSAIWAFLGVTTVHRVFYALGDPRTPVKVGLWTVVANLALNYPFMYWLGGAGLAYATSVSTMLQLVILACILRYRMNFNLEFTLTIFLAKILLATALMSFACQTSIEVLAYFPDTANRWTNLLIPIFCSISSYAILLRIMHVRELNDLIARR